MTTFAGLDVSQARTTICIVDERGCVTWRGSCATGPRAIAQTLATRACSLGRVGLESGPLSPWLVPELRALELPVVCLDARHARVALSVQINKSDANDADGLAQIVRTGWYREVEVKSVKSHLVRATLGVRKQLVGMRTEMINQIRGLMKIFGLILPKGGGARFEANTRARLAEHAELGAVIEPLLAGWRALDDQIAALEGQLVRRARRHEVCHRLMTVPGVGPLTALAFVTRIDDRSGALSTIVECRCLPRSDAPAPPIGGARRERPDLQMWRPAHPQLPVRSRERSADQGRALVVPQGLGDQAGQAERRQQGESRARAQARHVAAPALAGRHHLPLDSRGHRVMI
jgi:transposase